MSERLTVLFESWGRAWVNEPLHAAIGAGAFAASLLVSVATFGALGRLESTRARLLATTPALGLAALSALAALREGPTRCGACPTSTPG